MFWHHLPCFHLFCFPICFSSSYLLYSHFPPILRSPCQSKLVPEQCPCWITIKQPGDASEGPHASDATETQLSNVAVSQAELTERRLVGFPAGQTSSLSLHCHKSKVWLSKTIKWITLDWLHQAFPWCRQSRNVRERHQLSFLSCCHLSHKSVSLCLTTSELNIVNRWY